MKIPNKEYLIKLGFTDTGEQIEYNFRMNELKLILMPLNTFVLEIWVKGELINGQRLDFNSFEEVEKFIKYFIFTGKAVKE